MVGLKKRFGETERQVREEKMKRKEESEVQTGGVSEGFGGKENQKKVG